jgi:hypothetical protein
MLKNITLEEIIDEVMPMLKAHRQDTKFFVPSFSDYDVYDAKYNRVYPTHHWSQLKEMKTNV